MLEHGGRLRLAAREFEIPLANWLDLSTGLAPYVWPLPDLTTDCWKRLPESDDGLEQVARDYYAAPDVLPVAGSQAAIQALPGLCDARRVGIVEPCYAEHRLAWQKAGCQVIGLAASEVGASLAHLDVLVVVNPNNPTGQLIDRQTLLEWHDQLHRGGGWLVVDEAFVDLAPEHSLAPFCDRDGLIVLRSLGKFFGLGGARLGFVLAEAGFLQMLERRLGPWTVSGPAREVGKAVLADHETQELWRSRLQVDGQRLELLLTRFGLTPRGGCDLFQWVPHEAAQALYIELARRAILVRRFAAPAGLRFGLPHSKEDWERLEQALSDILLTGALDAREPISQGRHSDSSGGAC